MIGGHYTYAEVPLFDNIKEWLGQDRNNYDKVGHFAQDLSRHSCVGNWIRKMSSIHLAGEFFRDLFCLALSAFYELIEWWVAVAAGISADAFLGTQGYLWDTQSDMLLALIGAIAGPTLLGTLQDTQLRSLPAHSR